MLISLQQFRGIRPKIDPELLPPEEAQTADNVKIRKGLLRPWDQCVLDSELVQVALLRTIYLYCDTHWLEWDADVDIVPAPIAGDTAYKLYYTGAGIPKKTNFDLATTGAGAKPISFYPLALPSPKPAPTAGAPGAGGAGDARDVNYVWTFVSNWGEESLPSPASNTVAPTQGQTVALSLMTHVWQAGTTYTVNESVIPTVPNGYLYKCIVAGTTSGVEPTTWGTTIDGNTTDNTVTWRCYPDNMSYKRIYRLNVGDEFGQYQYLTQIAAADTTYNDTKTDTELGEPLLTEAYDPPPDGLTGLTYMANGIIAGFSGKDVYFSEPYKAWAFPTDYIITVPASVVSLGSLGETIVVNTDTIPHLITGTDPASMTPVPLPEAAPCVSKRGTVATIIDELGASRGRVLYPAPDGLYMVDGAAGTLLTRGHFDKKTWADYHPTTMHGHVHDNFYFGFYSYESESGCLVVDLLSGDVTPLSLYADAAYVDPKTDTLYYIKRTSAVLLQEGGTSFPSRANALLQEDEASYILRE